MAWLQSLRPGVSEHDAYDRLDAYRVDPGERPGDGQELGLVELPEGLVDTLDQSLVQRRACSRWDGPWRP